MESTTEAPTADSSKRNFSQVVFTNIPHSYSPCAAATCTYTFNEGYQPHPRDWVGIFKVGWSTTKDYHTFVWAEHSQDGQEPMTKTALFKDYYLPKDETEFYQFCYIDSNGQVRGASTPFSFKGVVEPSMESIPDGDILFITTQEQVEKGIHEKTKLQTELDQLREECETTKRALQKEQQDTASLKRQNDRKEKENTELARELERIKERNENLRDTLKLHQQEIEDLKEKLLAQKTMQMEIQPQSATEQNRPSRSMSLDEASISTEKHTQEKYDRAVLKIKQMKQEREELKGTLAAQSEEISTLNLKFREGERELLKTKDSIHLMQVDLQSSEKEKERLFAEQQSLIQNMEDMKRENEELRRRLTLQDSLQGSSDNDLQVSYEALVRQLEDTEEKLAAEKDDCLNYRRRTELFERDLRGVRDQLESLASALDREQQKSNKFELQFMEAREAIEEGDSKLQEKEHIITLLSQEKDELTRENQNLRSDIDGLRNVYANFQDASQYMQPDDASAAGNTFTSQEDPSVDTEHLYETIGSQASTEEEPVLVCHHCQESFPGITQVELEQHEQSHRVCPFCTMICDNMEQGVFEDHVYSHEL